jgi:hypothetical protein
MWIPIEDSHVYDLYKPFFRSDSSCYKFPYHYTTVYIHNGYNFNIVSCYLTATKLRRQKYIKINDTVSLKEKLQNCSDERKLVNQIFPTLFIIDNL